MNVETQQHNPHSLLWWLKHLISARKQLRVFGRGSLEFLQPANHKVLAFTRRYQDECLLVMANLSHHPQCVELDLSAFQGMVPAELSGQTRLPPVEERPYFLNLHAYACHWFALERPPSEVIVPSVPSLPTLTVHGSWENVLQGQDKGALEAVLPAYLQTCYWFGGKARTMESVTISEVMPVPSESPAGYVTLVQVVYMEGEPETYVLPLTFVTGDQVAPAQDAPTALAHLRVRTTRHDTAGVLYPLGSRRNSQPLGNGREAMYGASLYCLILIFRHEYAMILAVQLSGLGAYIAVICSAAMCGPLLKASRYRTSGGLAGPLGAEPGATLMMKGILRVSEAPQQQTTETADTTGRRLLVLSLTTLGVVYGDIGTSPLYAIRECFHGEYGILPTPANILGVLSLMCWSLLLIVSVKYLSFIMRADNRGEGGVIALTALLRPHGRRPLGPQWFLIAMGLFAASLLYGDGMITPAISVLSAVEGLRTITPVFQPYIVPITMVLLIGLFLLQRRGTGHVGVLFGPITLLWLITIGTLGLMSLWRRPDIVMAVSPIYGMLFLWHNHLHGFLVLGAIFLVVTGTEALYADMGHFGKRPIRLMWFVVVLPALFLNYFGQGALLLEHPEAAPHPFYAMAPDWFLAPLVILATAATIIASQAVISGAFSLTRQAIQLGYLPRMQIIHTSPEARGQIYIPQINTILMLATLVLVLGFGSSSRLAAAYGVAVTTTMLITSMLFFAVATQRWHWHRLPTGFLVGLFMIVDLSFFVANIGKITHGAWFPLLIGAGAFLVMITWDRGRTMVESQVYGQSPALDAFLRELQAKPPGRIPGKALYLAGSPAVTPSALLRNLRHNRVLHDEVAILTLLTEDIPSVNRDDKVAVEELATGFYRVVAHFGFMEEPNVPYALALAREKGLPFELAEVSFFLGRERLMPARRSAMSAWRLRLFMFMSRNALGISDYFRIPPEQVVELGAQIEI